MRHASDGEHQGKVHSMLVAELMDVLKELPGDAEVILTFVAPGEAEDELETSHYDLGGVVPFDAEEDEPAQVWLVGGEDDDVDALFDELESADEDE
jgi:hypothetical protein